MFAADLADERMIKHEIKRVPDITLVTALLKFTQPAPANQV